MTAVEVGRIQDKTRWTKTVGEAVTFVYGDWTEEIGQSRRNRTAGYENTGPSLTHDWLRPGGETPQRIGQHFRSDEIQGILLGEASAISVMTDFNATYNENLADSA